MVRYLIILIIAAVNTRTLWAQEPSQSLVFEERVFNFGTIQEKNGKVSHTFYFRNTGKTPVTISDVNTGCSCMGNVLRKGPIKPGERTALTITFDPSYKSGFVSKEIFIFSEGGKQYNHVWMEGTIIAGERLIENDYPYNFGSDLHLRYKVMALGYLQPGQSKKMELPFANTSNKPMTLSFTPINYYTGLQFTNPGTIAPNGKGSVTFTYTMPFQQQSDVSIYLDVFVNGKKVSEPVEVKVRRGKGL